MGGDFRLLLLLSLLLKSWGHGLRVNGPWKYQGCCSFPIEPLEPPKRSSMTASKGQPELPPEKPDPQNMFPTDASQAAFAPDIPSPGASVAVLHRPITYMDMRNRGSWAYFICMSADVCHAGIDHRVLRHRPRVL